MGRLFAVVASVGVLAAGLSAQQRASAVAGKWEVTVTGQAKRLVELTVKGTEVTGVITSATSDAMVEVTGEYKNVNLSFWTAAKEEFFGVMVREGAPVQGTYVHCVGDQCSKSGVTMRRPTKAN